MSVLRSLPRGLDRVRRARLPLPPAAPPANQCRHDCAAPFMDRKAEEDLIPEGIGYYRYKPQEAEADQFGYNHARSDARAPWGQGPFTEPFSSEKTAEDAIPEGIGYYHYKPLPEEEQEGGDGGTLARAAASWAAGVPLAAYEEGDAIPPGRNYYAGAGEEYDEPYLRDAEYLDGAPDPAAERPSSGAARAAAPATASAPSDAARAAAADARGGQGHTAWRTRTCRTSSTETGGGAGSAGRWGGTRSRRRSTSVRTTSATTSRRRTRCATGMRRPSTRSAIPRRACGEPVSVPVKRLGGAPGRGTAEGWSGRRGWWDGAGARLACARGPQRATPRARGALGVAARAL